MKVAISGSSGFIGGAIYETLSERYECRLLSRNASSENFFDIECDLDVVRCFEDCHAIIHCAGIAHVGQATGAEDWAEYNEVNVMLTLRLASLALEAKVRRFIFLSSLKVGTHSVNELERVAADRYHTRESYVKSKALAESRLWDLLHGTHTELVIIRPPLVYGPGVGSNFKMIYDLCNTGLPLPFGGLSTNKRSLIFIQNLVDFVEKCIFDDRAANELFLVADAYDLSTAELVTQIRDSLGMPPRLFTVPTFILSWVAKLLRKEQALDTLRTSMQADMTYTRKRLNWEPPFTTSQGLLSYVRSRSKSLN